MADYESVRQRIVESVFSKRNAGGPSDENYVSHIKIWEDAGPEGGGTKPRYILLSQSNNGSGYIHKSKLNTNGSFSVGKTWKLQELRAVRVEDATQFAITLARTYRWQTESQRDQNSFLVSLVRLFRTITGGAAPLQLEGFTDPDAGRQPISKPYDRSAPSPSNGRLPPSAPPSKTRNPYEARSTTPTQTEFGKGASLNGSVTPTRSSYEREREYAASPPPGPRSQSRTGLRPASPARSQRSVGGPSSTRNGLPSQPSSSRSRPASPSSQSASGGSNIRPRQPRRPSNGSAGIPSINAPSSSSTSTTRPSLVSQSSASRSSAATDSYASSSARPTLEVPSAPSSFSAPSPSSSAYSPAALNTSSRGTSPAPSVSSSRKQGSRGPTPAPRDDSFQSTPGASTRGREHNARVSFFDQPNQTSLDRLITGGASGVGDVAGEVDGEENAQATMASVEEMLEGYEWASDDVIGRKTGSSRGAADLIEARLLDELTALDKANIHSFLESDDRVDVVLKFIDDGLSELDNMESLVSSYKIHLNAVGDDISFIQSQNRGLQVQTQNQRALLAELENLLQTVHVDRDALLILTQETLERSSGIQRIEEAATELYKALQAGRDREMAATMERLDEYRTHNAQFCKRVNDFFSIMFTAQCTLLLGDSNGLSGTGPRGRPTIINHQELETYLGRYAGIILYLKEMDESMYAKTCATYFSAASDLHGKQMKALMSAYAGFVKKASEDEQAQSFSTTPKESNFKGGGLRRAGTVIRSPLEKRDKGGDKGDSEMQASEALGQVLEQVAPRIYGENDFIADFLQINDAGLTFADYMSLENYFRRQAVRAAGLSQTTVKLVRGAMDLIFGFLPTELKTWLDGALAKDSLQLIGIIATLERFLADADERGNAFLMHALEKQHTRLKGLFDRHTAEQVKGVEETKLNSKKRRGVAHFIKYFPIYVGRVEQQLIGADGLEIRANVDIAYEKIVQTMFDSLKQMAKMEGEGEDKGQLNYHVILIENAHYFVAEISELELGSVSGFIKRAEAIYDENLAAYVKIVLRRPFAKIIDYFEGVERLLKTTAPTEISSNSSYNKSALKKVVKEYTAKDIRKHVDALQKRVEKHFTEASEKATTDDIGGIAPGTVVEGVWKACEDELQRVREVFATRIAQCYADTGVTLDFTKADIEAAFRRQR